MARRRAPFTRPITTFVLLLAGCASYQPHPLASSAVVDAFQARSIDAPGLQRVLKEFVPDAGKPHWDLTALTGVAFYYHSDLDVARARWRVAEAAVVTAGARPNPTLNLSEEFNSDAPQGTPAWSPDINFSIPIETVGKRGHRIAQAQQLAEAARLNLLDIAWTVRSRVRSSLLNLYPTEPLLAQQQALEAERVRLMERRLQLGFAATPDLTLARIALQQATLAHDEARNSSPSAPHREDIHLPCSTPRRHGQVHPHANSCWPGNRQTQLRAGTVAGDVARMAG